VAEIRPSQQMLDKTINAIENLSDEQAAQELLNFSKEMGNVLQGLKSLGMVNKRFYKIVNDPKNTDYYIRTIAKNWGQELLPVAIALGTPGAKKWIQDYIAKPEGFKEAKALLFVSAVSGELGEPFIYALKQVGFNLNVTDENGKTVLFYAAENGDSKMVKYLIKHGVDQNLRDNAGRKAISYVPQNG
jgi:hypothetical protein